MGGQDSRALWNVALHMDWSMSNISGVVKTHMPCGWSRLTCPVGGQDSRALWNVALHMDWSMFNISRIEDTHFGGQDTLCYGASHSMLIGVCLTSVV